MSASGGLESDRGFSQSCPTWFHRKPRAADAFSIALVVVDMLTLSVRNQYTVPAGDPGQRALRAVLCAICGLRCDMWSALC